MFKNIGQVWQAIDKGETIHAGNSSYKVYVEPAIKDNSYQRNHFSYRNGEVLTVRCISNYFGSIIDQRDLSSLFVKGSK